MADTRVILLIFSYVACLNASNNLPSLSTMTPSAHSEAPNDLQSQMKTSESTSVASVTEATTVLLSISTTISTNTAQSAQTSSSPTASKSVTKSLEPDPTTATINSTVIQSINTTTAGTVTEPQSTLSERITSSTKQGFNETAASTEISPSEEGDSGHQSKEETKSKSFDGRYLWLLLLVVAVLAAGMFLKFRCCKIHHHPVENIDHGTENASFQRTESKDGVMLLGVKSGGDENVAAK